MEKHKHYLTREISEYNLVHNMEILEIFKKTLYNQMQIKFPRVCIMVQIDINIFNEEHSETPINSFTEPCLEPLTGPMQI